MSFIEIVDRVVTFLQNRGRVSYRILKREFDLNDSYIEDLKAELIDAKRLAADEDGKVFVWAGGQEVVSSQSSVLSPQPLTPNTQPPVATRRSTSPSASGRNREHWKRVERLTVSARRSPRSLPTSKAPRRSLKASIPKRRGRLLILPCNS